VWLSLLWLLQACSGLATTSESSWPSPAGWRRAALTALKDPHTWVPAAAAAVFAAGDWDREFSDWARRERPLFGSPADAGQASDVLLAVSIGSALGTALPAPDWPQRLSVQLGAFAGTGAATFTLKYTVGRSRPDDSDALGFPSGHAAFAFSAATLTRRNLAQLELSSPVRNSLDAASIALAAGTAWARLEAGVHYPSDVLAGAALGNFMAAFINDAWLAEGGLAGGTARLSVLPLSHGMFLQVSRHF